MLVEWGKSQHQIPQSNLELKNKILANFSINQSLGTHKKKSLRTPWLSLLLAGTAAFIFFMAPGKPNFGTYKAAPSTSQSDGSQENTVPVAKQGTAVDASPNPLANMIQPQPYEPNTSQIPNTPGTPLISGVMPPTPSQSELKIPNKPSIQAKPIPVPPYNPEVADRFRSPQIPYPPQSEVPSTDNREFLKTSYSASVLTRKVQDLSNSIQTAIRGFGGRVDLSSSSNKLGYISFVVPADKFSAFSQQIKNLAGERFYKESIQTENLLPQKKNIEADQKTAGDELSQLNAEKARLTKNHNLVAGSIRSQINSYSAQLTALQNQRADNLQQYLDIQAQKQVLQNAIQSLQNNLAQENDNFAKQMASADSYIQNAQNNLQAANQQNGDLLDTVATVHGTITLNWINIWELINFYVPLYWIALVLILGAITTFFFRRRSVLVLP